MRKRARRVARGTRRRLGGVAAVVCATLCLLGCVSPVKAPVVDRSGATEAEQRGGTYVVRPKDTLYSIAFRHEMDYRALAAANGIAPPYVIKPGQRIRLVEEAPPRAAPAFRGEPERTLPQATPVQISPAADTAANVAPPVPVRAPAVAKRAAVPETQAPERPAQTPQRPPQAASGREPPPNPPAAAPRQTKPAAKPVPTPAAQEGWLRPVQARPVRRFGAGSKGFDYELPPATRIRAATSGVVVYAGPGIGGFRHLVIVKASEQHLVAYGVNVKPLLSEGDEVEAGAPVAEVQDGGKAVGRFHFEVRRGGKPVDPGPLIGA